MTSHRPNRKFVETDLDLMPESEIECPACKAPPGKWCVPPPGKEGSFVIHGARIDARVWKLPWV